MLDHGGNLDLAEQRFGGRLEDWIDLSTGINRHPYPLPKLEPRHWGALPSRAACLGEFKSRIYQRDMGKRLREISQLPFRSRIVLLCQ